MLTALSSHGYGVAESSNTREALQRLRLEQPDLVIIDMNLPNAKGLEFCRRIRDVSDVGIIAISSRTDMAAKIRGLDAGADDFVTTPFGVEELLARIRAALRRVPTSLEGRQNLIVLDHLQIDFLGRRIRTKGATVRLTPKELKLLRLLVSHRGQIVSHRKLLQAVWGPDFGNARQYLRVFINQLRKKIESDPANPEYILTEPCVGYRFAGTDGRHHSSERRITSRNGS